jgi:phosphoribosylformylglycinamidine synthase PurS subunit
MWNAKIIVEYKEGILDPEAKAIRSAFNTMGHNDIKDITTGRFFHLEFDSSLNKAQAEEKTQEVCHKLLSNPVIENYKYELEEVD